MGKISRKENYKHKKCKKADEEEKLIVKEFLKDTNKYFSNDDYCHTNKQLLVIKIYLEVQ